MTHIFQQGIFEILRSSVYCRSTKSCPPGSFVSAVAKFIDTSARFHYDFMDPNEPWVSIQALSLGSIFRVFACPCFHEVLPLAFSKPGSMIFLLAEGHNPSDVSCPCSVSIL